ncbi:hypothetical protein D9M71_738290 [compost metagenome]
MHEQPGYVLSLQRQASDGKSLRLLPENEPYKDLGWEKAFPWKMDTPSQSDVPPLLIRVYAEGHQYWPYGLLRLLASRQFGYLMYELLVKSPLLIFPCPAHLEGWPDFLLKQPSPVL